MPKLTALCISHNRFKTFGEKLPNLPAVTLFDFRENKIAELKEVSTIS